MGKDFVAFLALVGLMGAGIWSQLHAQTAQVATKQISERSPSIPSIRQVSSLAYSQTLTEAQLVQLAQDDAAVLSACYEKPKDFISVDSARKHELSELDESALIEEICENMISDDCQNSSYMHSKMYLCGVRENEAWEVLVRSAAARLSSLKPLHAPLLEKSQASWRIAMTDSEALDLELDFEMSLYSATSTRREYLFSRYRFLKSAINEVLKSDEMDTKDASAQK